MLSYLVKTPRLLQRMFPKRVWAFPNKSNTVYLTFDDGPVPEVTPWVLETLKKHNATATFFCIGDNVQKHPLLFQQLIAEGHAFGNHTYHHLNGWKTKTGSYLDDVNRFEEISSSTKETTLFRPPYGKATTKQARQLLSKGYQIIMWDVLSADFHPKVSEEQCLANVLKHIQPGSIVVFHDSLKAEKKLRYTLPKVLDFIAERGWNCEKLLLK